MTQAQMIEGTTEEITRQLQQNYPAQKLRVFVELEATVEEQFAPAKVVPESARQEDPTLALFDEWEREDAARTPEQVAADDRVWEEFEKGINANRQEQGMRLL